MDRAVSAETHDRETVRHAGNRIDDRQSVGTFAERAGPSERRDDGGIGQQRLGLPAQNRTFPGEVSRPISGKVDGLVFATDHEPAVTCRADIEVRIRRFPDQRPVEPTGIPRTRTVEMAQLEDIRVPGVGTPFNAS